MASGSSSNKIEYVFTADTKGLEQGVKKTESLIKDASDAVGKGFTVNWGEGSGSIKDYNKWLDQANKEWKEYSNTQAEVAQSTAGAANSTSSLGQSVSQVSASVQEATSDFSGYNNALYSTIGSMNDVDGATQALLASITALELAFAKESLDSFAQYEDAMYGMATTVGLVGGTIEQAMQTIQDSTANGLLSETDVARAINNLTSYGYTVGEASKMIQELTNVSMAHRNETLTVSEQVERLTESIKRGSTQMLKNNGIMQQSSDIYDQYANELGKTSSELTTAEKRQAMYNAVLQQGEAEAGVASAYQESYSAATQRLSNSMNDLKAAFGQALAPLATWLANLANWLVRNKELVVGIGTFVGVIAGAGGLIVAITKLLPLISTAIAWFSGLSVATKGLVLGLATVATTMAVVAATSSKMTADLAGIVAESNESAKSAENASDEYEGLGTSMGGVAGKARDLSKELESLRRQYLDDLKQIETRHKDTIDRLTKQIQDANVDYRRAIDERNAEFAVSQAKEEKKHQEKVDDIMAQIAFLQRYNNDYNKQKLANLQFALAEENALYQKQTEAAQAELELQNENDRKAYEEKRASLQAELDEELAFMSKHREDLKEVQNWILEDEIESLKRRYEEQQASYAQQTAAAGSAGTAIGDNFIKNLSQQLKNAQIGQLQQDAFNLGSKTSKSVIMGVWEHLKSVANNDDENFLAKIWKAILGEDTFNRLKYGSKDGGWATGGYTGRGAVNEVAGIVHKGEYVLPQDMVDQNTGTPKAIGNTYNITITGTFATSAAERRKVADQIVAAINQNNKSRLEASWQ